MNFDFWILIDKVCCFVILIVVYFVISVGLIVVLGLYWLWYLVLLSVLVFYGVLYVVGYVVFKVVFWV